MLDGPLIWKLLATGPAVYHLGIPPTTLDQACQGLPAGAYTTLRTYGRTHTLHLEEHFSRLEQTAALAGHPLQLERESLRQALRQCVAAPPLADEFRLRLQVDLEQTIGEVFIVRALLSLPPEHAYIRGVAVVSSHLQRENPRAKLTGFISRQSSEPLPAGVNEGLLLDEHGCILEGRSSNFFAVRDGVLWTAQQGVLEGITRKLVLEEAVSAAIELRMDPVPSDRLAEFQEAFITSASRGVLPVTQVDGSQVGDGLPGPVTRLLGQRFSERLARDLEPI